MLWESPETAPSYNTLAEAGIEEADLLIAVTESDELNLLCCVVAKKNRENARRSPGFAILSTVRNRIFC